MASVAVDKLKEIAVQIAPKYGLKMAILYGSQAAGTAREDSDIDIAVLGNRMLGLGDLIEIADEFGARLGVNMVDVKSLHRTDPLFRQQVAKKGILLFGEARDFISFKIYAFRDYVESASLFRLKEELVKKRLELK